MQTDLSANLRVFHEDIDEAKYLYMQYVTRLLRSDVTVAGGGC